MTWVKICGVTTAEDAEACVAAGDYRAVRHAFVQGTLRREADVGFMTCKRGHRIIVHRVGRQLASVGAHRVA